MFKKLSLLFGVMAASVFAQFNTLTATTLSAAVGATDKTIIVASATGISAPSLTNGNVGTQLYVVAPGQAKGEVMQVVTVSSTTIGVRRANGGPGVAWPSGAMVLAGAPNLFYRSDPAGACTASTTTVTPWVNIQTGAQWLCSSVTGSWVPGWHNDMPIAPTAAVASAAGLITPSGPLFHITGTAAITGFNIPVGFAFGRICAVPDGAFTTTTANNIGLASTGVVSKTLCWTYDSNSAKFYPAY